SRDGVAGTEPLSLPLRIVGIAEGAASYASRSTLERVEGWRTGKLEYDSRRGRFETPGDASRRSGYVRATVFAADEDAVETVVRELQRQGYRTTDQLAALEGLRRMGRSLLSVVTISVLGPLLAGALCVLVTSLLNLRQKRYE